MRPSKSENPRTPFQSQPRIAVVGCGAIGSYYGAMLARAGNDVHFLLRSDYETVCARGIQVDFAKGEAFNLHPVQAYRDAAEMGTMDIVLVALKATANPKLPELLRPLVGKDTWIVTLQNGMGNAEWIAQHFGAERVLAAICFISLNRTAPGKIFNHFNGYLSVAEFKTAPSPRTALLKQLFEGAGVRCDELDSLDETLWRKLCWNIPFNGLAIAAGGVTTDVIVGNPHLSALAEALMNEIRSAAAAYDHTIPDAFLQRQFDLTRKMGAYKPSSLIDYLEKKPLEVEPIWGEPLRRAQARNVPTPKLEMLYQLIASQSSTAKLDTQPRSLQSSPTT